MKTPGSNSITTLKQQEIKLIEERLIYTTIEQCLRLLRCELEGYPPLVVNSDDCHMVAYIPKYDTTIPEYYKNLYINAYKREIPQTNELLDYCRKLMVLCSENRKIPSVEYIAYNHAIYLESIGRNDLYLEDEEKFKEIDGYIKNIIKEKTSEDAIKKRCNFREDSKAIKDEFEQLFFLHLECDWEHFKKEKISRDAITKKEEDEAIEAIKDTIYEIWCRVIGIEENQSKSRSEIMAEIIADTLINLHNEKLKGNDENEKREIIKKEYKLFCSDSKRKLENFIKNIAKLECDIRTLQEEFIMKISDYCPKNVRDRIYHNEQDNKNSLKQDVDGEKSDSTNSDPKLVEQDNKNSLKQDVRNTSSSTNADSKLIEKDKGNKKNYIILMIFIILPLVLFILPFSRNAILNLLGKIPLLEKILPDSKKFEVIDKFVPNFMKKKEAATNIPISLI